MKEQRNAISAQMYYGGIRCAYAQSAATWWRNIKHKFIKE